ncbi:class I SAM-dependent methyltransferase [Marinisporobacter balticus]|uniref:Methyltransferase family protein n=1 Tax=Marinisporobacter balticus TaxID=2018667 RepID=A0A4R2K4F9_9FIRM|nr:class I SAM-dependent methyltransferase [Marinisporobacter balticus]TCO68051.1 methyltransferase family protein [Marinisporobacter balticus]
MSKEKIIRIYEERAKKIKTVDNKKVFLKEYRKSLLSNAKGQVLEVGVGRGTNFQFYPSKVKITAVDFSPSLLEIAKSTAIKEGIQVEFVVSDVEKLEFKENSFDTIVSTLSLCAYDDPVKVLNNFNKLCKSDGQILLLEHGVSSNKLFGRILNKFLNVIDEWNVTNMGCHSNRDILKAVKESNIKVERVETCLLGTHYLIWAKSNHGRNDY